jgi:hypothetical protein
MSSSSDQSRSSRSLIPDTPPLPEALFGGVEALEDGSEDDSFWSRFLPPNVSFMNLPILDRLQHRPYHAVLLEGPFDLPRLARDHASALFRTETSLSRTGKPAIERLLITLGDGVFAFLDDLGLKVYAPTPQAAHTVAQTFRRYVKPTAEDKPRFFVISIATEGPVAERVVVERAAPLTDEDLRLNYGDDFPEWEQQWLSRVRKSASGLTILHGPPGTGKTSFLRALMNRLLSSTVFYYVPISEAEMLSSPRFVNFWIAQSRRHKSKLKIAILEDAEDLLRPREDGTREKVSNLLNIADGLLGDHLRLHLVTTTNAPISQLDPAVVRPGRLVGDRAFRRLTRAEAARLAAAKQLALPDADTVSLAELYCGDAEPGSFNQERKIGFA